MKKLMIAAAIVCAAAFAQAAVFNWNGMLAIMDNNSTPGTGTIEFFLDGDSLGTQTLESGLAMFSYDLDDWGTVSAKATLSNFSNGTETGFIVWSQSIDADWLKSYPDAENANLELNGYANAALLNNVGIDFKKSAAENGYTSNVPEPTSGLLLLLGVAGLALRRRRA